jgi:hypothetical protein
VTYSGTGYSGNIKTGTDWMTARVLLRSVLSLEKGKGKVNSIDIANKAQTFH